jgi:hypothetical protein
LIYPLKMVIFHSYVSLPEGTMSCPSMFPWLSVGGRIFPAGQSFFFITAAAGAAETGAALESQR